MIYVKAQIAPGIELKIDLDPDELFTVCPLCKEEHQVAYEILEVLEGEWSSTITCGSAQCSNAFKNKEIAQ